MTDKAATVSPNPFRTFGFNEGLELAAMCLEEYAIIPRASIEDIAKEIRTLKIKIDCETTMMLPSILKLQAELRACKDKISAIQNNQCPHPKTALSKVAKSSTGGYDGPSSDQYWYEFHCQCCDKRWSEDQ